MIDLEENAITLTIVWSVHSRKMVVNSFMKKQKHAYMERAAEVQCANIDTEHFRNIILHVKLAKLSLGKAKIILCLL